MIFANSKRLLRHRLAAIVASVVFTVALVPPGAAQSTESPTEAPPVVTLQAFLLDKGVFAPLDVPCVTQVEGGQESFELTDLNNRGQIVGFCTDADGTIRGIVLDHGAFTNIEFPGAVATAALGINDRRQIVGSYSEVGGADVLTTLRGFLLDDGVFTSIDIPDASSTDVEGINNRGQMVGRYTDAAGTHHGFLLDQGRVTTIDVPGATLTVPFKINDRKQIVGLYSDTESTLPFVGPVHGFLFDNGEFTRIDFPGALSTQPIGINNRGQIVGAYNDEAIGHGFLLQKDTFTTIDAPGAVLSTAAFSINDRGQILILTASSEEEAQ
jgi:uncharacterized membrane protein